MRAERQSAAVAPSGTHCTYLLTIRRIRFNTEEATSFRNYLRLLTDVGCKVFVVDGSPRDVFAALGESSEENLNELNERLL